MNAFAHADGVKVSLKLKLSKPVTGLQIIAAVMKMLGNNTVLVPYDLGVQLGGTGGHRINHFVVMVDHLGATLAHIQPAIEYNVITLEHCTWPTMFYNMTYEDPEQMVLDHLKAIRKQLESILSA